MLVEGTMLARKGHAGSLTVTDDMMEQKIEDELKPSRPAIHTVKIADIATRPHWQVRNSINQQLVWDYVTHYANGAAMPPLQLARINGALILVDGWHRLSALRILQHETVEAIVEDTCEEDARWQAAIVNTRNGLRLKRSERRRVFRVFVQTGRHRRGRSYLSYRAIARELGGMASKSIIQKWMREDFPKIATRMSSGREENAGASPVTAAHTGPYARVKSDLRGALQGAIAEARGMCPTARLLLAKEVRQMMERIVAEAAEASRWEPEPEDTNDDF